MTLDEALAADRHGMAVGLNTDGMLVAEATGPLPFLSKRKKKKQAKGSKITIFHPPCSPANRPYSSSRVVRVRRAQLGKGQRALVNSLDWRPNNEVSAIDRLAAIGRRIKCPSTPQARRLLESRIRPGG
jgi:hypothetical protein